MKRKINPNIVYLVILAAVIALIITFPNVAAMQFLTNIAFAMPFFLFFDQLFSATSKRLINLPNTLMLAAIFFIMRSSYSIGLLIAVPAIIFTLFQSINHKEIVKISSGALKWSIITSILSIIIGATTFIMIPKAVVGIQNELINQNITHYRGLSVLDAIKGKTQLSNLNINPSEYKVSNRKLRSFKITTNLYEFSYSFNYEWDLIKVEEAAGQ